MDANVESSEMPLQGKTYSLCAAGHDSEAYYRAIHQFAENLIPRVDLPLLLETLRRLRGSKRKLHSVSTGGKDGSLESYIVQALRENFSRYTKNVEVHLRGLTLLERWDRTLRMNEAQYHLCMLEIEVSNRLYADLFRKSDTRLAFLPHCLHDLSATCRSTKRGEDYVCKGCSGTCGINAVSKLLRRHGVSPYIWKTARLEPLFKRLRQRGKTIGVLGIACIPELANGMRRCARAGVPAIGIPLNANRCARWWGEFHPNSVNLQELEHLLGHEMKLQSARTKKGRLSSIPPSSITQ